MNCLYLNHQLILIFPDGAFAQHGVMAIEYTDFDGMERPLLSFAGPSRPVIHRA